MEATLSQVLKELRADHRNMARLLDLIENELLTVESGDTPDLELLHDIMQYMIIYSDAIHHPREDLVYNEMRASEPELARGLEQVESDHEAIAELGLALRNDIGAMMSGVEIRRDRVLTDTIDYVRKLRRHMEWEEQDLFLRADRLAEREREPIDLSGLHLVDPVFGDVGHGVFDNLRQHLDRAGRDSQRG